MRSFNLLVAAFALLQFIRYVRAALIFVAPSVELHGEAGVEPETPARLRVATELASLGFAPLGRVRATGPLGAWSVEADAFASLAHATCADVVQRRPADEAHVEFFTAFADGAVVLTSTAARRAIVAPHALVGSMPGVPLAAVLAAHRKGVERLSPAHGSIDVVADLDRRVEAGRRWYRGEGRRDLRRSHLSGFLVAMIGLVLFASSAHILLRAPAAQ